MNSIWPWLAFIIGWALRFTDRAQYTIQGPADTQVVDTLSYCRTYWWKILVRLAAALVVFAAVMPVGITAALVLGIGADAAVESLLERSQQAVNK